MVASSSAAKLVAYLDVFSFWSCIHQAKPKTATSLKSVVIASVVLVTKGSTRGLEEFRLCMPSVDTRQVLGDRLDGEPGTRDQ